LAIYLTKINQFNTDDVYVVLDVRWLQLDTNGEQSTQQLWNGRKIRKSTNDDRETILNRWCLP